MNVTKLIISDRSLNLVLIQSGYHSESKSLRLVISGRKSLNGYLKNWANLGYENTADSTSDPSSSNQANLLEFEASKKILSQLNGNLALVNKHQSSDGITYEITLPVLTPNQEDDVSSLQPSLIEDLSKQEPTDLRQINEIVGENDIETSRSKLIPEERARDSETSFPPISSLPTPAKVKRKEIYDNV